MGRAIVRQPQVFLMDEPLSNLDAKLRVQTRTQIAALQRRLGVIGAARDAGMTVPGDLSVVGFDDIEISGYAGLTTVRQPLYESGRLGARVLLEALDGDGSPIPVRHELPLELVVRSTTSRPRTEEHG
jgi:DNA-binding LacI/PurR family transcriptional regulator